MSSASKSLRFGKVDEFVFAVFDYFASGGVGFFHEFGRYDIFGRAEGENFAAF